MTDYYCPSGGLLFVHCERLYEGVQEIPSTVFHHIIVFSLKGLQHYFSHLVMLEQMRMQMWHCVEIIKQFLRSLGKEQLMGRGHMTLKDISQFCSFDSLARGSRHGFAAGLPYAGAMYNPTQPYVLLDRRLFTQPGAK